MNMDIEYIKKIADLMTEKSLSELSVEDNGQKILLKKFDGSQKNTIITSAENITEEKSSVIEEQKIETKQLTPITSPMVGTFYNSASPDADAEPFVNVGDVVQKGQIVCIIEAMKLMNEIEAEVSGKVAEICVENGQTIEFGQVLMYIE